MEDYENLIKVLSVSVNRDNTNAEYLEVLRNAYMKIKNYEKACRRWSIFHEVKVLLEL